MSAVKKGKGGMVTADYEGGAERRVRAERSRGGRRGRGKWCGGVQGRSGVRGAPRMTKEMLNGLGPIMIEKTTKE
jgi:hypothetical protein